MLLRRGSWPNIKSISIHDFLQLTMKPFYILLQMSMHDSGAILRVPRDYILFSLTNWMAGKRLIMSVGVYMKKRMK